MLAMSPYFYPNELLVQSICIPLWKQRRDNPPILRTVIFVLRLVVPFRVSLCVCVYFPGGSTPIVSILTEKSSKFVQIFFLFDIRLICTYNLGIKTSLEQQQSILSRALAQLFRLLTH